MLYVALTSWERNFRKKKKEKGKKTRSSVENHWRGHSFATWRSEDEVIIVVYRRRILGKWIIPAIIYVGINDRDSSEKNSCYLARNNTGSPRVQAKDRSRSLGWFVLSGEKERKKEGGNCISLSWLANNEIRSSEFLIIEDQIKNPILLLINELPVVSVKSASMRLFTRSVNKRAGTEWERRRRNRGARVVPADSPCTSPLEGFRLRPGHCVTQ